MIRATSSADHLPQNWFFFSQQLHNIFSERMPEKLEGNDIKFDFNKFLVDREGKVVRRFEPYIEPEQLRQPSRHCYDVSVKLSTVIAV